MPSPVTPQTSLQRIHPLRSGRLLLFIAGLLLTVIACILFMFPPLLLQQMELRLYDIMISKSVTNQKSGVPVIVGIDEESLNSYGQWPWPRYRLAKLIDKLEALGAHVVVLDFLMPEADRTSPEIIMAERSQDLGLSPLHSRSLSDANSKQLAKVLAKNSSTVGYYLYFSNESASTNAGFPKLPKDMLVLAKPDIAKSWPRPTGLIRSIPDIGNAATTEGFTNVYHDADGVLRRTPLLLYHSGSYHPSLAFSAAMLASKERKIRMLKDFSDAVLVWDQHHIPIDISGNVLINFRRNYAFPYFSAREILEDKLLADSLSGKTILVGAYAKGLSDMHNVPYARQMNGVEVHATILDNILSDSFILSPEWGRGAGVIAVLLLGLISAWLISRPGFLFALLSVIAISGSCYASSLALLTQYRIFISPLIPMATPGFVIAMLGLFKYGLEARKVRQRNLDLIEAQDAIIVSMSALTEMRDEESGKHVMRTRYYVGMLASQLAKLNHYATYLDETQIELLAKSAPLHDIGKVGIPDYILRKPGALTDQEYEIMKTHTLIGAKALSKTIHESKHPEKLEFLRYALQMAEAHHENWDGSGYPHGLSGVNIPLPGRLMAVADAFDALVSRRVYKDGVSYEEAEKQIVNKSGMKFDPEVVTAFLENKEEFIRIAEENPD